MRRLFSALSLLALCVLYACASEPPRQAQNGPQRAQGRDVLIRFK